jgi:pentapeptide MXKDX repeat protein
MPAVRPHASQDPRVSKGKRYTGSAAVSTGSGADGAAAASSADRMRHGVQCSMPRGCTVPRAGRPRPSGAASCPSFSAVEKFFLHGCHFGGCRPSIRLLEPMYRRDVMKNVLLAACVAAFAAMATAAYAQNDAMSKDGMSMSKDAMGHDAMAKDGAMKKGAMKKHAMKKDAMGHDAMSKGDAMKKDAMSPSN